MFCCFLFVLLKLNIFYFSAENMSTKLTDKEYKKLVIKIAVTISPILIQRHGDIQKAGEQVSLYAKEIANAMKTALEK